MSGFFEFYDSRSTMPEEEEGCLPALSFKERVAGFAICFGMCIVIDILSFGSVVGLVTGSPVRFAMSYTLANILAIVAVSFLIGPTRQLKSMFAKKRWIAASVFVGSMLMTLISALVLKINLLVLVFILIQMCAYIWYVLSYIPWGRSILAGCFKKCCGSCLDE